MTHKTPEEAAKAVLTGDLGPLNLTFSEFRYRMTTEWPQEPLSDQFLFDLYHDLTDKPEDTPTFSKLKALLEDSGIPFNTIPLVTETTQPEDLFGPVPNIQFQYVPESPEEHDILAAIERIEGKVDKAQELQERILRMQLAQQAAARKNKRSKAIAKVRSKFRRKGRR